HRDGLTERRLNDRQVDLRVDVVAFAHEAWIGLHAHEHVDVARPAAQHAGVPLAAHADALPIVDAGRDVDVQIAPLDRAPGAFALRAGVIHDLPAAAAGRTRLGAHELAEDAAGDLLQPTRAVTGAAAARL